ncbi:TetR/AcrR family transcriptional regulator [Actinophytocola xinjiangensis]|uniref:TetR/AcrR family transcriptional regulator n=1 Tax=Actinophytocola xinjiangensis TaxID=485602 RepID=UPI001FECFADA|nr:helix-turn-helix domain-containing protein [Actinophytocola xinjiangensis]
MRPKVPLISRRRALEVALAIVDDDGLEALSIRRLAGALGVNSASLYHHFRNKEDILAGMADLVLAEVREVGEPGVSWRDWLPGNARALRRALLAHPALLPVLVASRSHGFGEHLLDASAARLMREGVPSAVVMPLLDALAAFAVSSALHEARGDGPGDGPGDGAAERYPALAKAVAERGLTADQIYDLVIGSILAALDTAVDQQRARWMSSIPVPVDEPL